MSDEIISTMSLPRFATYLAACGHNQERAMRLYVWNAKVGAAFHPLLQATEVALRNRVNVAFTASFGENWWNEEAFLSIDEMRRNDLRTVRARLQKREVRQDTNQTVASLSFGFWVGALGKQFNPDVWSRHLSTAFPNLSDTQDRDYVFQQARNIADFRNRISHHEPIIRQDVLAKYSAISSFLDLICPPTTTWIKPHCEIPVLVRHKP